MQQMKTYTITAICTLVNIYDLMPHVHYFVCLLVALWTILSLMLTTSHPKSIGGVCYGTITDICLAL